MKMRAKRRTGLLGRVLYTLPAAGLFMSCSLVREGLPLCVEPALELRFVYEYNMEYANAFHRQVDCLSAYFFDTEGHLVLTERETDVSLLSDEGYRMYPSLSAGRYHVVVYGGMDCEMSSFSGSTMSEGSRLRDLQVHMNPSCLTDAERRLLHNHYYGSADIEVLPDADSRATVELMRNTNTIQVALQHMNGRAIDCSDFEFEITDDNNDFDHENNLLATGEIIYKPYNTLNSTTGTSDEASSEGGYEEWHAALARFTTSRLVKRTELNNKRTSTRLHVRRVKDGETVFSIPLVNYMLMFKNNNTGAGIDYMGDQEYLDRENRWNFVFFLDENDMWLSTRIIINDWEVRLNTPDF